MTSDALRSTVRGVRDYGPLRRATLLLLLAPLAGLGTAVLPFHLLGRLVGVADPVTAFGIILGYPTAGITTGVALGAVSAAAAGRDEPFTIARNRAVPLAAWGLVAVTVGPILRLASAVGGRSTTTLSDTRYMGRRAIFYAVDIAVLDDEPPASVWEMFTSASDRFQAFHGSNDPVTEISGRFRLLTVPVLVAAVGAATVHWVVSVGLLAALAVAYLHAKRVAHALLHEYNVRGEPPADAPSEQLSSELYDAAFDAED